MRWLVVYFPLLALEWEQENATPRALLDGAARRIVLANPEAEAVGVVPGLALATALSLAPGLETASYDDERLKRASQTLALELGRWSGRISCIDSLTILAEVASMQRYFNGIEALVSDLKQALQTQQLSFVLGLANTPRAALALARAKVQLTYDESAIAQQISQLPLRLLGLPAKDLDALRGLGIERVEQLERLPRQELGSRFHPDLLKRIDQLRGKQEWLPPAFEPPEIFEQHADLQAEISYAQGLLFPLQRILGRLEGYLNLRQQHALVMSIALFHRDKTESHLRLGHAGGCYKAQEWLALLRLKLERYRLTQPVLELSVRVEQFRDWDEPARDLFEPTQAGQETPEQLLSRIQIRLGSRAIDELAISHTHLPGGVASLLEPTKDQRLPYAQRPLWLVEPPQRLSKNRLEHLRFSSGPERIQSDWWNDAPRRDYFTVDWNDGRLAWVFRDPQQHWYLHGWFS